MSFIFKTLLILFALHTSCRLSFGRPVTEPRCSSGVCAFNVLSHDIVATPCDDFSVIVAYGQKSGITMIQCSSPDEESKILLYNRDGNREEAYQFDGGRFFRPDSLPILAAEGVPDKFASVPLCSKKQASAWGELIIAEKTVTSGDAPYCYRINRVKYSGNGMDIVVEDGGKLRPLSEAQLKQWTKIRTLLSPYIPKNAAPDFKAVAPAGQKAVVQSIKAPLYSSSTSAAKTAKYLVHGDEVTILDSSNDHDWFRIRYITKAGKVIEMWLQARDVK